MKDKKTFRYCEYCDRGWLDVSPPSENEYENGLIEIDGGCVLLPKNIAGNTHTANIGGIYCGLECLKNHIAKIMKLEEYDERD